MLVTIVEAYKSGRILCLLMAFVILQGCKTLLQADVYVSDLFLDENVRTPASMLIEIPSCTGESREDYTRSVVALFDSASEAKVVGCESQGMDSLLNVSFLAEIASENSSADLILFRNIADQEDAKIRGLKPVLGVSFLNRVDRLMRENMQSFQAKDLSFSIALNNDQRAPVKLSSYMVWVDGEAYERYTNESFDRREKLEISFSNVTSDLMIEGAQPTVLWVALD